MAKKNLEVCPPEVPAPGPRSHSRLKGSGKGYLARLPSISFRLAMKTRAAFEKEAQARNVSNAALARLASQELLASILTRQARPIPAEGSKTGHSRLKGDGYGYMAKEPPIAFRLLPAEREAFDAEAEARNVTYAELARVAAAQLLDRCRRLRR
jgi:uncharacterized protein YdbL (DUF1318 family)